MKKNTFLSLLLLTAAHLSHAAVAKDADSGKGFYTNAFAGLALIEDGSLTVKSAGLRDLEFEINSSMSAGLLLGYDFGSFRVEGEYTYVSGDIDTLKTDTGDVSVDSEFESNSLMLNGLFDFDLNPVTLSAGLGLGASKLEYGKMVSGGPPLADDTEDTVFVYQGILRGNYAFTENASLGLSYRYVVTADVSESGVDYDGVGASLFEVFFSYQF